MCPRGLALQHPAAAQLLEYSTNGCPVDSGKPWTLAMLEAAILRGAHPSARDQIASRALHTETLQKVKEGYARLIPWSDLKANLPDALKLSPIAAIPHKSRLFRMILDLSFGVREGTTVHTSVNEATTDEHAPLHAMGQLGKVLPRLIYALANLPDDASPVLLAKLDIQDGFWRMVVPDTTDYNFAYVLPQLDPADPIMIVVPSSLQMGWKHSPPFFCAASETGRDVAQRLVQQPIGTLPTHPLEHLMMDGIEPGLLQPVLAHLDHPSQDEEEKVTSLLEVYVDDFIGLIHATDPDLVRHYSRALLHGIHSVFPPPDVTGHHGGDPISRKKMLAGDGVWAVRKEILGWMFDGITRTIELPPDKFEKILKTLDPAIHRKRITLSDFRSLTGKLQHASLAVPAGHSLLAPLHKLANTVTTHWIDLRRHPNIIEALRDFKVLSKVIATRPTHARELVPGLPSYIGYSDACNTGAGGVWLSGAKNIRPTVWRVAWPEPISSQVKSPSNPTGTLSINDLEAAAFVLQFLVLEQLVNDLRHDHVAIWCDNQSTVSWARKLSARGGKIGWRLMRALGLRLACRETSPLIPVAIAGKDNDMADYSSRSFGQKGGRANLTYHTSDDSFLRAFASTFPLATKQDISWQLFRVATKLTSLIFSELLNRPRPMASWRRITKSGGSIGRRGATFASPLTWTTASAIRQEAPPSTPCVPLPLKSDEATSEEVIKSAIRRYKSRYVPSARLSNWTDSPTHSTDAPLANAIGRPSNDRLKATVARIRRLRQNLPSPSPSPTGQLTTD
jgi:hypothetical protein